MPVAAAIPAIIGAAGAVAGPLLAKGAGGGESQGMPLGTGTFMQANKAMKSWLPMLQQQLAQQQGLISGKGTPQELPWFKGFQEQLMKQGQDQEYELIKQAIARGVTGNSLSTVLGQLQESRGKGILNTINEVYRNAPTEASRIGNQMLQIRGGNQIQQPAPAPQNTDWMKLLQPAMAGLGSIASQFGSQGSSLGGTGTSLQQNPQWGQYDMSNWKPWA